MYWCLFLFFQIHFRKTHPLLDTPKVTYLTRIRGSVSERSGFPCREKQSGCTREASWGSAIASLPPCSLICVYPTLSSSVSYLAVFGIHCFRYADFSLAADISCSYTLQQHQQLSAHHIALALHSKSACDQSTPELHDVIVNSKTGRLHALQTWSFGTPKQTVERSSQTS